MSLVLEIEFLSGICFAAQGPDTSDPDWPPQPDRVFSALVAAWAARGEHPSEASALEWLEGQRAPLLEASDAWPRRALTAYVPPNDPETGRVANAAVFPSFRKRQARRFPAARPHEAVMRLVWNDSAPSNGVFQELQRLAADTTYIGHSASLTRCVFFLTASADGSRTRGAARWVYRGRFSELREGYAQFVNSNGKRGRASPGALVESRPQPAAAVGAFDARWLLLEHVGGDMPDVRASAIVAKTIRNAILSGYKAIGLGDTVPEIVSGHAADGQPTGAAHVAVVPMLATGFPYADGHVVGFAVVPPSGSAILDDADFLAALRAIAPLDSSTQRRALTVSSRRRGEAGPTFTVTLSPAMSAVGLRRSLDPAPYVGKGRIFATVTPVVLDRHLKEQGAARTEEIAEQIVSACRKMGLPAPTQVFPDKHPTFEGVPSAYPSAGSPPWMRWRLPTRLQTRQLTHAVFSFPESVVGPVLLGAGRFVGMGLCRRLERKERDA